MISIEMGIKRSNDTLMPILTKVAENIFKQIFPFYQIQISLIIIFIKQMHKQPPDSTTFYQLQSVNQENIEQELSPQATLQKSRKQYFYIKLTLSIFLVTMATISVQTQVQYYGPFVRTVQNFFNYHMLEHDSQDIYQGSTVVFYRTQQYFMAQDIMAFFNRYADTMDYFRKDSFFYPDNKQNLAYESYGSEIVKIFIISEVEDNQDETKSQFLGKNINQSSLRSQVFKRNRIFMTKHEQEWILQRPLNQIRQFFNLTVLNKQFYQRNLKKIELQTSLNIKFKNNLNCTVEVKTICIFYSSMMMAVKLQTRVLDYQQQTVLQSNQQYKFNAQSLGIRKLSQFHHMNFDFKYMAYFIFLINSILFCVQIMVVIRTNNKINESLREERQFEKQLQNFIHLQKLKNSPKTHPGNHLQIHHDSLQIQSFNQEKQRQNMHILNEHQPPVKSLSYKQRLELIGFYNMIQLTLSFLVLITVNSKGLICLWCWARMSIYLSQTGNRMMFGFLFKKALPAYIKIIMNLSVWLSGIVFFSMVTYQNSKKFQTVQLSYYEYLFNYFQYGIFQNFRPISREGSIYSFLYFIQMAFLVMIGNNILQSILAQQVLKNSNMKNLIEFIEGIQVECPVCGCPPQVKKKIKLKLDKQNQRQNRFISQYFQAQKQASNKSKYQIKILSPQFSPMFHKSQYNKKQFKLRKVSASNISIVSQESINSPPSSPIPLLPFKAPLSPYTPGARALQEQRKKVKIQIGGEVQEKKLTKLEQITRQIKTKSQIINKILHQLPRQHKRADSSVSKQFHIQFLKRKLEQIKQLTVKMK